MSTEQGTSLPQPEEQKPKLSAELLGPQIDPLIESFRNRLSQSIEFKEAFADNYLHTDQSNLKEVEFQRGKYQYFVNLLNAPELTDEEPEEVKNSGLETSVDWKDLIILRSLSEEYRQEGYYSEYLTLHVEHKYTFSSAEVTYERHRDREYSVNTRQALEKAREIIDSF